MWGKGGTGRGGRGGHFRGRGNEGLTQDRGGRFRGNSSGRELDGPGRGQGGSFMGNSSGQGYGGPYEKWHNGPDQKYQGGPDQMYQGDPNQRYCGGPGQRYLDGPKRGQYRGKGNEGPTRGHGGQFRGNSSGQGYGGPDEKWHGIPVGRSSGGRPTDRSKKLRQSKGAEQGTGNWHQGMHQSVDVMTNPGPLQILEQVDGEWELRIENLETILLHPDIKDRHLVVLSVVGKFRIGKSFLMSVLLNHLQRGGENGAWLLEEKCVALPGFEWKNTVNPVTSGILMWSKAFPLDLPSGEKIAVVLMDTQGTFDLDRPTQQSASIFAISTMISSVQIYNLQNKIGGDDLDHFTYFTEYGSVTHRQVEIQQQTASSVSSAPFLPFQHLHILIRDWTNSAEFPCGFQGGNSYLRDVYTKGNGPELRKKLDSCFTKTECTLLPYPGAKLASEPIIDGVIPDMDTEFRKHLANFVNRILDPTKMVIKTIEGQPVTPQAFIACIDAYTSCINSGNIPDAESYYNLNANATHYAAVDAAVLEYHTLMDNAFGGRAPSASEKDFRARTEEFTQQAWQTYLRSPKLGGCQEKEEKYSLLLEEAIQRVTESKFAINDSKVSKEKLVEMKRELNKKKAAAVKKMNKEMNAFITKLETALSQAKLDLERSHSNGTEVEMQSFVQMFMKELKDSVIKPQMKGEERTAANNKYIVKLHHELDVVRDALNMKKDMKQEAANRNSERRIRDAEARAREAHDNMMRAQREEQEANIRLLAAEARDREHQKNGWTTSLAAKIALGVGGGVVLAAGAAAYVFMPAARPAIHAAIPMVTTFARRYLNVP